jgi:hypothetical protein
VKVAREQGTAYAKRAHSPGTSQAHSEKRV